jgi:hypothetical protein
MFASGASPTLYACLKRPKSSGSISLRAFVIGDRWRDKEAGCRAIFIDLGCKQRLGSPADQAVPGLPAVAAWILS